MTLSLVHSNSVIPPKKAPAKTNIVMVKQELNDMSGFRAPSGKFYLVCDEHGEQGKQVHFVDYGLNQDMANLSAKRAFEDMAMPGMAILQEAPFVAVNLKTIENISTDRKNVIINFVSPHEAFALDFSSMEEAETACDLLNAALIREKAAHKISSRTVSTREGNVITPAAFQAKP